MVGVVMRSHFDEDLLLVLRLSRWFVDDSVAVIHGYHDDLEVGEGVFKEIHLSESTGIQMDASLLMELSGQSFLDGTCVRFFLLLIFQGLLLYTTQRLIKPKRLQTFITDCKLRKRYNRNNTIIIDKNYRFTRLGPT